MSLQVWLPFTNSSDFNNYGLSQEAIIEKSAKVSGTGYGQLGAGFLNMDDLTISKNYLGLEGSICFWLYQMPYQGTYQPAGILMGQDGISANSSNRKWSLFTYPTRNDLHSWGCMKDNSTSFNGNWTLAGVIPDETWVHIAYCHDKSNQYVYINGELKGTYPWDSSGTITFGQGYPISTSPQRRFQDFRMYDHCLSQLEVTEISMGCVANYTMDLSCYGEYDAQSSPIRNSVPHVPDASIVDYPSFGATGVNRLYLDHVTALILYEGAVINTNINPSTFLKKVTISFWAQIDWSTSMYGFIPAFVLNDGYKYAMVLRKDGTDMYCKGVGSGTIKYYIDGKPATKPIIDSDWHHYICTGLDISSWTSLMIKGYMPQKYSSSDNPYNCSATMYGYKIGTRHITDAEASALYAISIDNKGNLHSQSSYTASDRISLKSSITHARAYHFNELDVKFDNTVYREPDGSLWLRVYHQNNIDGNKKGFDQTMDVMRGGVYQDADNWYNGAIFRKLQGPFEFMYIQKRTSTYGVEKFRWSQPVNPLNATWDTVAQSSLKIYGTSLGYTAWQSYQGGMYPGGTAADFICRNANSGNTYGRVGAIGFWNNQGTPCFHNGVCTTGYTDFYVRIDNTKFSDLVCSFTSDACINANRIIEI